MEFGAGIGDVEAPVDAGLSFVPLQFQGVDFPAKGSFVWETLFQTAAGEDAEFDFRPGPTPGQAMLSQLPCLGV